MNAYTLAAIPGVLLLIAMPPLPAYILAAACLVAVVVLWLRDRKHAAVAGENATLRAKVARLEAENDALNQDNMRMASELVDPEPLPRPHLYAVQTPLHDDLAVEQLRAELNDQWFSRMHGWGDEANGADQ